MGSVEGHQPHFQEGDEYENGDVDARGFDMVVVLAGADGVGVGVVEHKGLNQIGAKTFDQTL